MSTEWGSFEELVAQVLRAKGFVAEVTQPTSDGGIDVIAHRQEPLVRGKYVVQCKNWSNPVGVGVVRDLYGAMTHERASKGIVITTSSFTQGAIEFAKDKPLELIDGEQWRALVKETSPAQPLESGETSPPRMVEGVECIASAFDNLAVWARRQMRRLDDLHEKEPIVAAEYAETDLASDEHRIEYGSRVKETIRSFGNTMGEIGSCIERLKEATKQWGVLEGFSPQSNAEEELEHYISRYHHLVQKAFATHTGLREVPPPPRFTHSHGLALKSMHYGLSAVLSGFIQTPEKRFDGKTVIVHVEAPQDLFDYYVKRYKELLTAASDEFVKACEGPPKCPRCGATARTTRFCTQCGTKLRM